MVNLGKIVKLLVYVSHLKIETDPCSLNHQGVLKPQLTFKGIFLFVECMKIV